MLPAQQRSRNQQYPGRPAPPPSRLPFPRFHPWSDEALVSVARRFLADVPALSDELRESVAQHMAFAHQSVTAARHK